MLVGFSSFEPLLGGEQSLVEASMETKISDFKALVLEKLVEDDLERRVICVDLTVGERQLEDSKTLAESDVNADVAVLAVLRKRSVECIRKQEAPYSLNEPERAVILNIPVGTSKIPESAFAGCSSLDSLEIPSSVALIGSRAFIDCSSLRHVSLPESLREIGGQAFMACNSIESIGVPSSVTKIGNMAFARCSSLLSFTIPPCVTGIEGKAFQDCSSLRSLTISGPVVIIRQGAFERCSSLLELRIPSSVRAIEARAFSSCSSLSSLTLPESVNIVGEAAFHACSQLKSLTLPLRALGPMTLVGCPSSCVVTKTGDCHAVETACNGSFRELVGSLRPCQAVGRLGRNMTCVSHEKSSRL